MTIFCIFQYIYLECASVVKIFFKKKGMWKCSYPFVLLLVQVYDTNMVLYTLVYACLWPCLILHSLLSKPKFIGCWALFMDPYIFCVKNSVATLSYLTCLKFKLYTYGNGLWSSHVISSKDSYKLVWRKPCLHASKQFIMVGFNDGARIWVGGPKLV